VPKIELGRVGAVLNPDDGNAFIDTAAELDELGYPTIWLTGGQLQSLSQIADTVRATSRARIATAIISVDRFPADQVAALYTELEASLPGRFVAGLGGAHGANPLQTLTEYLARLGQVPQEARVLAALGPKMLDLAREHAAGALPVLITPDRTAELRSRLGDATTLAVDQLAVVETDPGRARAIARGPLGFLGQVPAYQANFRRMGFTDEEIAGLADRLVDALVPWGDAAAVAAAVQTQLRAGADHVAIALTADRSAPASTRPWRELADRLL
jgi:probable F420-dependent oxidoreductase